MSFGSVLIKHHVFSPHNVWLSVGFLCVKGYHKLQGHLKIKKKQLSLSFSIFFTPSYFGHSAVGMILGIF